MRLNRRNFLSSAAALGATAFMPATGFAQQQQLAPPIAPLDANTVAAQQLIDTIEPILSYDTANNLQFAISQYEPFAAAGGWYPVSQDVYGLALGANTDTVPLLRQRLMSSGDLAPSDDFPSQFDDTVDRAVRVFQARHGLIINGSVDEATYFAMAVPADVRVNQLKLNLARVNALAGSVLSERYVLINIPAATIEAVEGSMVAQRHTAVVGRIDRQTPILTSKISQINFNPYWHVPKSIIRNDLIKYMKENPQYLTEQRIHIYDGNGQELAPTSIDWNTDEAVSYMFRQEPGSENAMGHVKINFSNPYDVYLHDTPQKALFGENTRFHSSGCVRVGDVQALVSWLLRSNGDWDAGRVDSMFQTNERLDVSINSPVPIHTTYITAWANRQGTVSFRDDVYLFDSEGKVSFG